MHLIRGLQNLDTVKTELQAGCVLTIGNFDGIHLGHRAILDQVINLAKSKRLPSVVMIFEPLPIEYFAPQTAPVRLMNLREKLSAFKATDIDYVLVCRFNEAFANLTPMQFVESVLKEGLNVRHLVVGDDFCFGKQRQGNFDFLDEQGRCLGFEVTDVATFEVDGARVSSTRVRQALLMHDLAMAERLLGEPFHFHGRVIHGQKLGRKIGFRTLNLNPKRIQMPLDGVYAVNVSGLAAQDWPGVANIGIRPTVDGSRPSIEVHLFDWDKDVYGAHISVRIEHYIRAEMKFENLTQLTEQIERDAQEARQFHGLTQIESVHKN
ncbi:MAG: bifunctional riboflavin kinase/FAD synthetase [Hydrogenovibrio crunogenus]|uniref:Riboflavin biosynthesis protein n=1 Tax=Hydrogenovibrio crunogenus (strain DSM 25203 / XCL-2) TaxID=317025 RepID=Q31ID3_HYDCU|nr:bifunctional riboflavin kinase/FAD synthetase [Hydrogenovibrio crunogenus]